VSAVSDGNQPESHSRPRILKRWLTVFKAAAEYIGEEPDVQVTYLASLQEPMNEFGIPSTTG
jgi:hypothetical protein